MNDKMIKESLKEYINKAINIHKVYIDISKVKVTFIDSGFIAGSYRHLDYLFTFNRFFANQEKEKFNATIAHEVAHMVVKLKYPFAKQHHGKEFKMVMKSLGHIPRTYHSYDVINMPIPKRAKNRYQVKCICKVHLVSKQKLQEITRYRCGKCMTKLEVIKGV
jgi:predicted SprT family Zn-dependent metalloprotease